MNMIFVDDRLLPIIDRLDNLEIGTPEHEYAFVELCIAVKHLEPNPNEFGVYKGIHLRTTISLCRALMRGEPWKVRYEFYYLVAKGMLKTIPRVFFNRT